MSDTLVINEIYLSLQGESTFAGLPCVFVRLTACNLRCSYCDTAYAFTEGRKMLRADVRQEVLRLAQPFSPSRLTGEKTGVLPLPKGEGWGEGEQRAQIESCVQLDERLLSRGETVREAAIRREPDSSAPEQSVVLPLPKGEGRGEGEGADRTPTGKLCAHGPMRLPLVELTGGEPLLQPNSLPLMRDLCDDGFTVLIETSGAHDISGIDPRVRRIMDLKCPSSGEAARNRWENLPHLKSTDEVKFVIGTVEDYEWAKAVILEHRLTSVCPLLFSWVAPLTPEQQDKSLKKVPEGQTPLTRRELAERIIADALPVRFQVQMHKVIWAPDARGV